MHNNYRSLCIIIYVSITILYSRAFAATVVDAQPGEGSFQRSAMNDQNQIYSVNLLARYYSPGPDYDSCLTANPDPNGVRQQFPHMHLNTATDWPVPAERYLKLGGVTFPQAPGAAASPASHVLSLYDARWNPYTAPGGDPGLISSTRSSAVTAVYNCHSFAVGRQAIWVDNVSPIWLCDYKSPQGPNSPDRASNGAHSIKCDYVKIKNDTGPSGNKYSICYIKQIVHKDGHGPVWTFTYRDWPGAAAWESLPDPKPQIGWGLDFAPCYGGGWDFRLSK